MCNRARSDETLRRSASVSVLLGDTAPDGNRFNPAELSPRSRAYVIREQDGARGLDVLACSLTRWFRCSPRICRWFNLSVALGSGRAPTN